jgi:transposase InsO family protein
MYRLLRAQGQMKHRHAHSPIRGHKPKPIIARAANQVYSWDITYLTSSIKGVFFYLYLFLDVYSRKVVGWQVYDKESADYAADVLEAICLKEDIKQGEVILHSDNGSPMKGATMLVTMQKMGVIPSFSRPSVSNDNPYSEALFRTLKYTPKYPEQPFLNLAAARDWVGSFVKWYNEEHLHSGIKFVTPAKRHKGLDKKILENRHKVYQKAKQQYPHRWSGATRNWQMINAVHLNPEKCKKSENMAVAI